jgi:O-antigen/teichoic acid export membrane protein
MSDRLARNATLGLVTVIVERAIAFLTLLVAARVLAPAEFGVYAYLLAGFAPVQVMADQGIEVVAVAAMARRPDARGSILAGVFAARSLLWLAVALPLALVLGDAGGGDLRGAALAASAMVLVGPSLPYRSLARALGDMRRVFVVMASDALLGALAVVAALLADGGASALLAARVAASLVVTLGAAQASAVSMPLRPGEAVSQARGLAREAWPLATNALLLTLVVRAGHLVLMAIAGASAVAYMGAASRVAEMVTLLGEGVMLAVFPVMAAAPDRVSAVTSQVGRWLALLVLWAVVVVSAGSHTIMGVLYGADYLPGAVALEVLAWGGVFTATGTLILHGLVAAGRQRLLLVTNLGAMSVAVALQVVLVPRLGLLGSALATLAGLACGQVLLALAPSSRRAVLTSWRVAAPVILLAAVTQVGVALSGVPPWTRAPLAAVVFAAGAWVSGMVRRSDVAGFARALRRPREA